MSEPVRVPDPVYQRLTEEADDRDVSKGAVVEEWMRSHYDYQELRRGETHE